MCGRYDASERRENLVRCFGLLRCPDFAPLALMRPTDRAIAVRQAADGKEGALLRWGLVPPFAEDLSFGTRFGINARAETLEVRPAFRNAFRRRRCLLPARAYYEGSAKSGRRRLWRVRMKNGEPFAMAGLWEAWNDAQGATIETFAIVTTAANPLVARYHEKPEKRMPAILREQDWERWLDPGNPDREALKRLLAPYPEEAMEVEPAELPER